VIFITPAKNIFRKAKAKKAREYFIPPGFFYFNATDLSDFNLLIQTF